MLSEAKDLSRPAQRCFASLSMTALNLSVAEELSSSFEPCLRALALELYLKATILKSGKELVSDERFIGKANHSLPALAQEANINLNSSESALLSKLTDTINFWGRYPVPRTKGSWRRKVDGVEGVQPIWTWSEEELKVCDALLHRLREPL